MSADRRAAVAPLVVWAAVVAGLPTDAGDPDQSFVATAFGVTFIFGT